LIRNREAECMTRLKRIIFSGRMTGVPFFLIFILFVNATRCQVIDLNDFRTLGKLYKDKDQHFLSYTYNLSYYYMVPKSDEKLSAGFDALYSAMLYNRRMESETLFEDIIGSFPEKKNEVTGYYLYYLMKLSYFEKSEELLKDAENNDKTYFYRSYKYLHDNSLKESSDNLSSISADFKYKNESDTLFQMINQEPGYDKKYKSLAFMMSAILPGSGQYYAGSRFDGINALSFNLITGIATYSSWQYELTKDKKDRNYILPGIASLSFLGFYFSNLYNSVNITSKTNLYKEGLYYQKILDRFNMIISDQEYFLSYRIDF